MQIYAEDAPGRTELEARLIARSSPDGAQWMRSACPTGWLDIVDRLITTLDTLGSYQISQVKEKFGGLRFYYSWGGGEGSGWNDTINAVNAAETESMQTCEACGQPGEQRTPKGWWVHTLCDSCALEMSSASGGWDR